MVSAQEPLSALPGSHARVREEEQEPREQSVFVTCGFRKQREG